MVDFIEQLPFVPPQGQARGRSVANISNLIVSVRCFLLTLTLNVTHSVTFLFLPCALTDCVMTTGILTWPPTAPAGLMP